MFLAYGLGFATKGGATLPGDTLSADPQLSPLANRGGLTRTHGLGVSTDQRGTGYVRVVSAAADIGAYERQSDDEGLFADGFD